MKKTMTTEIFQHIGNYLLDSGIITVYNIDIYYETLWKFYTKNTHTDTLKVGLSN